MVIADLLAVSGRSWRADQSRRAPRIESDQLWPAPSIEVHVHSDAADWPVRAAHSLRNGPASSQALRARPPNARTLPALVLPASMGQATAAAAATGQCRINARTAPHCAACAPL